MQPPRNVSKVLAKETSGNISNLVSSMVATEVSVGDNASLNMCGGCMTLNPFDFLCWHIPWH